MQRRELLEVARIRVRAMCQQQRHHRGIFVGASFVQRRALETHGAAAVVDVFGCEEEARALDAASDGAVVQRRVAVSALRTRISR